MSAGVFNAFCGSLPHTHYVMQWGGSHVWEVAGKVFAIGSVDEHGVLGVSFKCSPLSFEILKEQPGLRPAPYLASRGMSWIQRTGADSLDDQGFKTYLKESYRLVALGLPKKMRGELGLDGGDSAPAAAGKARRRPAKP
jgi:predicted DNA-binding protein (MmcQ/YjbR family)